MTALVIDPLARDSAESPPGYPLPFSSLETFNSSLGVFSPLLVRLATSILQNESIRASSLFESSFLNPCAAKCLSKLI